MNEGRQTSICHTPRPRAACCIPFGCGSAVADGLHCSSGDMLGVSGKQATRLVFNMSNKDTTKKRVLRHVYQVAVLATEYDNMHRLTASFTSS